MYSLRVVTDIKEAEKFWRQVTPEEYVSDLWEVRACFHQCYQRPIHFVVAEDKGGVCGLLPLSWIEEKQAYGFFPGETWNGKTWLEQNRIFASRDGVVSAMLANVPGKLHLRYILPDEGSTYTEGDLDEIGYLFHPQAYEYEMEKYFGEFSHKSIKRILKEISAIGSNGLEIRYDEKTDFKQLVAFNIERFETGSYFYDPRFRRSFEKLVKFFNDKGWLRITTILIGGKIAAVDMGCVYGSVYTILAGGTNAEFPGIAKAINMHHLQRACQEKIQRVDFLCGDFTWKKLFHLTPRPLYLYSTLSTDVANISAANYPRSAANV